MTHKEQRVRWLLTVAIDEEKDAQARYVAAMELRRKAAEELAQLLASERIEDDREHGVSKNAD